jgi:hypothetical protein
MSTQLLLSSIDLLSANTHALSLCYALMTAVKSAVKRSINEVNPAYPDLLKQNTWIPCNYSVLTRQFQVVVEQPNSSLIPGTLQRAREA